MTGARGFSRGLIFTGRTLVASVAQEGWCASAAEPDRSR